MYAVSLSESPGLLKSDSESEADIKSEMLKTEKIRINKG